MFSSQWSQLLLVAIIVIAVIVASYYFKKFTGVDVNRDSHGRRYDRLTNPHRDNPTARLLDILGQLLNRNRRR